MQVLFDVTTLLSKQITPEGVYAKNLFRLLKSLGADITPIYRPLKRFKQNFIEQHLGHSPKKFYGFLTKKGTLIHGPSVDLVTESQKYKKIISINDMSMFREGFMEPRLALQLQNHLKEQLQKNPLAIILPSYAVHSEFLVRFPKYLNRVHVITPGCDHILDSSNFGDSSISKKPYFVFVGLIEKRSNVLGVLKAFNAFAQLHDDINLVVAGGDGYGADAIHKFVSQMTCRDRVKMVGAKNISQLKKIYSGAIATVVPSYYEGFHYPMLESMKMGCPVVTSSIGSMDELARGTAHLVNPNEPESIMAGMERVMFEVSYRQKMIQAGSELTQPLTWLNCARKVIEVYNSIQ